MRCCDTVAWASGIDLSQQQPAETDAWYPPAMYNIVRQNGRPVHIVIKPDQDCVVNSGLGSVRGARMAELNYSRITSTQLQRLTDPMVWRYGQMQPTSWDDALSLVAEITARVIKQQGNDGLFVSAFDHGGAGGGYENTWGTGKLYFEAMKIKNIRIHNRPAYNSEVHATRDMGVGELNNCYEDAELADTIVAVGTNALETQTNYFLNHWVPNLRGASAAKKEAELPGESHPPARVVIVDPRRTVTVNACEVEAGKDNVLHLAINSGTDLALFNAWLTYIAEQGWVDKEFLAASTTGFDEAVGANKTTLEQAAEITGLRVDQIKQAAHWIAEPKDGKRRRTMFVYEKGLIWGNDNYRTNGALVNVALATGYSDVVTSQPARGRARPLRPGPGRGRPRRQLARPRHVRPAAVAGERHRAHRHGSMVGRVYGNIRPLADYPGRRPLQPGRRALVRGPLHHRCLLVYEFDQLREPGSDDRARGIGHLRRHPTRRRPGLRRSRASRGSCGFRVRRLAISKRARPERGFGRSAGNTGGGLGTPGKGTPPSYQKQVVNPCLEASVAVSTKLGPLVLANVGPPFGSARAFRWVGRLERSP